jgi:hypothetical protein
MSEWQQNVLGVESSPDSKQIRDSLMERQYVADECNPQRDGDSTHVVTQREGQERVDRLQSGIYFGYLTQQKCY